MVRLCAHKSGTPQAKKNTEQLQERNLINFRHYRRAVGALLVYDITNEESFANAQSWLQDLKDTADPEILVMLVGNKLDAVKMDPNERRVKKEVA
jgi:GTPase SAR1 family protein